ncbi:unnamed protein product [Protopolystoma xenopodis]|uniref:Uncharacterized protein n=1 Tax=Protopolystoma xenopodis TaxID=117903 RepID=A0A3S5CSD4_9PLAT|nr:unnamed protein product [Protopolystoma xenopodis]
MWRLEVHLHSEFSIEIAPPIRPAYSRTDPLVEQDTMCIGARGPRSTERMLDPQFWKCRNAERFCKQKSRIKGSLLHWSLMRHRFQKAVFLQDLADVAFASFARQ